MMLPWGTMLRAALSAGIRPEEFWQLSLKEWRWLAQRGEGLSPSDLVGLLTAYPDKANEVTYE